MPVLTRTLPEAEIGPARQPRDDVVVEAADGSDRFTAPPGTVRPLRAQPAHRPGRRRVRADRLRARADGVVVPLRGAVPPAPSCRPAARPWWAPPESPDRHAATALGSLCTLAVVFSYIGTLLSQTITFAADEFDASKTQQGATLAAVRIGILGALALTALADRKGRRRVLLACAGLGCAGRRAAAASRPTWSRSASRRPSCAGWRRPAGCWWWSSPPRRCPRGRGPSRSRSSAPRARSGPGCASWPSRWPTSAWVVGAS